MNSIQLAKIKIVFLILFLSTFKPLSAQILNIESYRIKTDTIGWSGKFGLNFSLYKNTKSIIKIGNNTHIQYKTAKDLFLLLGKYDLLVSDSDNLVDKYILHFRYNYKFSDRTVGEFFLQGQHNAISKIDFRGLIGVGMRFKLSKNEKFRYYLGSTLMYEYENNTLYIASDKLIRWSNYFSMSIYPSEQVSIVSTTYYQPAFREFSDYRISTQNALFFKLSKYLSWKTGFNLDYDNKPFAGVPNTQYSLSSGIVYSLK
jgi:hypothetical protein